MDIVTTVLSLLSLQDSRSDAEDATSDDEGEGDKDEEKEEEEAR